MVMQLLWVENGYPARRMHVLWSLQRFKTWKIKICTLWRDGILSMLAAERSERRHCSDHNRMLLCAGIA
jgi:hypothetical protein